MMAAKLKQVVVLEHDPTTNDQAAIIQDHQQPSSSNTPPVTGTVSSPSSSSSTTTTEASSPKTAPIHALHYSILLKTKTDIDEFRTQISDDQVSTLARDSDKSTLLHVAASVGQWYFINALLQRSRHLLHRPNSNGDLPLHVAAKACQLDAVKILVEWDHTLGTLVSVNNGSDTALHIALRNHQRDMASFLFNKCPHTFYLFNSQGFSPLYLAIKAEFWDLVREMLSQDNVTLDSEQGLNEDIAKSVVHAAIIANKQDIVKMMLEAYNDLMYKTDEMNTTPLSYAAYTGFLEGVKYIISSDRFRNQAFIIDRNGSFPIHWACRGGYMSVVKELFCNLPKYTRLLLNNEEQNILHVAAAYGRTEVVKYILQQQELETLINMKDVRGNTPFHLASKGKHPKVVYALTWDDRVKLTVQNNDGYTALDIVEDYRVDIVPSFSQRLTWLSLIYAGVPRAPVLRYLNIIDVNDPEISGVSETFMHKNNTDPTACMVLDQTTNPPKVHPKMKLNKYKERINTLLVVSILVITVTYAAGFSVPGGYNNNAPNEGMATLAHKRAFQVFVISNTIAMYTSILAAVTLIWAYLDDLRLVLLSLDFALPMLGIALTMMSVAFMAGLYVVLCDVVSWLGIVVLVMGGFFLGVILVLFIPLYSPTCCIRNTILRRYVFHVPFSIMLLACETGKSGAHC